MATGTSTPSISALNTEFNQPLKGNMLWFAAILLSGANFIAVLDMTIANVSVSSIAGNLGVTTSHRAPGSSRLTRLPKPSQYP